MLRSSGATTGTEAPLRLDGLSLTPEALARVADGAPVSLQDGILDRLREAEAQLHGLLQRGERIYGVTTGFGANASVALSVERVGVLQRKLLLSHAVGVGPLLPDRVVRAMMAVRLNTLLRGYSGVSAATVELLAALLNAGITPCVPALGSVGASGDLAPMSHMALPLLGLGEVHWEGQRLPAASALQRAGLAPREALGPKEGLALNNGTALMAAHACLALVEARRLLSVADANAALVLEALCGRSAAFDADVHALRPHPGQQASAAAIRRAVQGSDLVDRPAARVPRMRLDPTAPAGIGIEAGPASGKRDLPQDAYSLRCAPQVHGAVADQLEHAWRILGIEINAVTDNPLLLPGEHGPRVCSAGHFHGMPIALAMAACKPALAALASIAERRLAKLLDPAHNDGLPAFLVANADGTDSGLMLLQYTAAALVNELATRAMPASVHSIPTCANVEDHVSMGANEARHVYELLPLLAEVLNLERFTAVQALRLRLGMLAQLDGSPPSPGPLARAVLAQYGEAGIPLIVEDGPLGEWVERGRACLDGVVDYCGGAAGPSTELLAELQP